MFAVFQQLMAAASEYMAKGDETSDGVKALVVRWRGSFYGFKKPEKHVGEAISEAFRTALNDPNLPADMPFDPVVFHFVAKVAQGMIDRGELA